jgi:hypothetical protein
LTSTTEKTTSREIVSVVFKFYLKKNQELVLKKRGDGSVLYIPRGESWKFLESLLVKLGADMVTEEE